MKLAIISEKQNPVMGRKELKGEVYFEGSTPPRFQIRQELAKHLKADPERVAVVKVKNLFGEKRLLFEAYEYSEAGLAERLPKHILAKNKKKEPKEGGSQTAEKKPEGEA